MGPLKGLTFLRKPLMGSSEFSGQGFLSGQILVECKHKSTLRFSRTLVACADSRHRLTCWAPCHRLCGSHARDSRVRFCARLPRVSNAPPPATSACLIGQALRKLRLRTGGCACRSEQWGHFRNRGGRRGRGGVWRKWGLRCQEAADWRVTGCARWRQAPGVCV